MEAYGALFEVQIKYKGSLSELVNILSKGLEVQTIRIENEEYHPYEDVAYFETLGFEVCITNTKKEIDDDCIYLFSGNTMSCFKEKYEGRMHDLSCFMARFIALECKVGTTVLLENKIYSYNYDLNTNQVIVKEE